MRRRLDSLTKPPGSLGELEEIAVRYAVIRGSAMPELSRKAVYVFCADHGVAEAGVSAYPSDVTRQMAANFVAGGAAINVLCRQFGIAPVVVDAGVKGEPVPGVLNRRIGSGTKNLIEQHAMTREEADRCIAVGRELAHDAAERFDIAGIGEMGIGNTTSASALFSALTGRPPEETAGRGTGLDSGGLARKVDVIRRALATHQPSALDPVGALAAVGGFEIGAIAGFVLGASERGLAIVLDGFITCAGALLALTISPTCLRTAFFSHVSAERGHRLLLEVLGARAPLDFGMRLGEGTGAAIMIGLIETAVRIYREMATFREASVTERL